MTTLTHADLLRSIGVPESFFCTARTVTLDGLDDLHFWSPEASCSPRAWGAHEVERFFEDVPSSAACNCWELGMSGVENPWGLARGLASALFLALHYPRDVSPERLGALHDSLSDALPVLEKNFLTHFPVPEDLQDALNQTRVLVSLAQGEVLTQLRSKEARAGFARHGHPSSGPVLVAINGPLPRLSPLARALLLSYGSRGAQRSYAVLPSDLVSKLVDEISRSTTRVSKVIIPSDERQEVIEMAVSLWDPEGETRFSRLELALSAARML